jgi:RsiW-degrading membrane proteinase PrsW (M82 family)
VIAARFIYIARQGPGHAHYYAVALIVATAIHGLYDYLIISSRGQSVSFIFVLGFVLSWAWRIIKAREMGGARQYSSKDDEHD